MLQYPRKTKRFVLCPPKLPHKSRSRPCPYGVISVGGRSINFQVRQRTIRAWPTIVPEVTPSLRGLIVGNQNHSSEWEVRSGRLRSGRIRRLEEQQLGEGLPHVVLPPSSWTQYYPTRVWELESWTQLWELDVAWYWGIWWRKEIASYCGLKKEQTHGMMRCVDPVHGDGPCF